MKKTAFLFFVFISILSTTNALPHKISYAPAGTIYNNPSGYQPNLIPSTEILVTHSINQSITSNNSVSCNAGGLHTNNSYFRIFDLSNNFGITRDFIVKHIEIGIELANSTSGSQPVTVKLHTLNGPLTTANLTSLYSETYNVPDQTLSIYNFVLATPVIIPAGKILVVEIFTPSGQLTGNSFFIGSNATPVASPNYLSAADCGVSEPATTGSIGFPGMNIVLNVYGANAVVPVPYGYIASVFLLIMVAFIIRRKLL
jgi:hypothetical protein